VSNVTINPKLHTPQTSTQQLLAGMRNEFCVQFTGARFAQGGHQTGFNPARNRLPGELNQQRIGVSHSKRARDVAATGPPNNQNAGPTSG